MKSLILLLVSFVLMFSCDKIEKPKIIQITSSSEKAKEYYDKARFYENKQILDSSNFFLDKALNLDSTFAMAYLMKGMIAEDFDVRRQNIEKAIQHSSNVSPGEKIWIKARNSFYGSQKNDSTEYDYFKQLVKKHPKDYYANYLFGFVNHHHGGTEIDSAIVYLNQSIALKNDFTLALNDLVYAYLENEDFVNAEKTALKNIEFLPQLPGPYDTYAEILMRQGKHESAIEAYEKVLNLDSTFAWSILGISANLNFLNRHNEARENLKKLESIDEMSDYNFRHKWRAKIVSFIDEGKVDSALTVLERQKQMGLKKATKHESLFHAYIAFSRKTRLYFENGDADNGMYEYYDWLKFAKENLTNQTTIKNLENLEGFYLAYSHYLNNEPEKALASLEAYKSLVGNKENEQYLRLKATILLKQGKTDLALKLIESTDLNNAYNIYLFAKILQTKRFDSEAEKRFSKIKQMFLIDDIDLAIVRAQIFKK